MKTSAARWIALGLVSLMACGGANLFAQQQAADTILSNGKIITVDEQFSVAQAVAIRGDRVVAVGSNQEIAQLAGPSTRKIDLKGKSVVPGMIDAPAGSSQCRIE